MAYKAKRKSSRAGIPRTYRGKPVEDAAKDFSFVVTTNDCSRGESNKPETCAAARAIRRAHPGEVISVHVHRNVIMVELKTKVIRYHTASAVRDQLLRFDAGSKFDTGTYRAQKVPASTIKSRGQQHSPPDRAHGSADNPRDRVVTLKHDVGRERFVFSNENSDYK